MGSRIAPVLIDGRTIARDSPVFVIAEVGVNHNGSVEMALDLVEAAHRSGADCVKFQTFSAERVATQTAEKAPYQRLATGVKGSQIEMLKALELPLDAYPKILAACRARGLVFLSTPYGPEDADFLKSLEVSAYKVASAQIVELSFMKHLARMDKPVILSTGMACVGEIDAAVQTIRNYGNNQIVLLQCTTNYPSRIEDANLSAMGALRSCFATHVGYSDHTESSTCCLAATALGAVVIEKHLTLNKSLPGPDHSASASPNEFRALVEGIRQVSMALGHGRKEPSPAELANRIHMRRSIVARVSLASGTELKEDLLTFKRPGTGLSPALLADILGLKCRVPIAADQEIRWTDLEH